MHDALTCHLALAARHPVDGAGAQSAGAEQDSAGGGGGGAGAAHPGMGVCAKWEFGQEWDFRGRGR
eukprot:3813643-Rhodomonas_salina.2